MKIRFVGKNPWTCPNGVRTFYPDTEYDGVPSALGKELVGKGLAKQVGGKAKAKGKGGKAEQPDENKAKRPEENK